MNRSKIQSRSLKWLLSAVVLTLLTLTLAQAPAFAQENAGYSAPVLFNQANAFARSGKPGPAILMYERAHLLAPDDPDVRANEHFVREQTGLPDASENGIGRIFNFASPNSLAWLGLVGLLLSGLPVIMTRYMPRRRQLFCATTVVGLVLGIFAAGSAVCTWPKMNEAVILAHESPARVSPVTVAETSFKLREGEIVTIAALEPDFALVHSPSGRSGWVARADLERIVPDVN